MLAYGSRGFQWEKWDDAQYTMGIVQLRSPIKPTCSILLLNYLQNILSAHERLFWKCARKTSL